MSRIDIIILIYHRYKPIELKDIERVSPKTDHSTTNKNLSRVKFVPHIDSLPLLDNHTCNSQGSSTF
jgi:hypothetical protein